MQYNPIGQVLLRFDAAKHDAAIPGQAAAITQDAGGNLWFGAAPLDGLLRLDRADSGGQPTAERPAWVAQTALDLAAMFELPDPGEPMDLTGLARADDRLWFVGSHASARLSPRPDLSAAQNLDLLTRVEPIPRRACLGSARISGDRLPEPRDLALLPIEDGGNDLTRALANDPHLAPDIAPGPIPMAERGLALAGLACRAGRLWIGLSGPVLGGFAVVLEVEPQESSRCVLELRPIGLNGRPYRKHLVDLAGRGVQDLRWSGDSLVILSGPRTSANTDPAAAQPGIFQLREAARLGADSLSLADDPRLSLLQPLAWFPGGEVPRAMELFDGLGQPGVLVAYGSPRPERRVGPDGVLADVFALTGG